MMMGRHCVGDSFGVGDQGNFFEVVTIKLKGDWQEENNGGKLCAGHSN